MEHVAVYLVGGLEKGYMMTIGTFILVVLGLSVFAILLLVVGIVISNRVEDLENRIKNIYE